MERIEMSKKEVGRLEVLTRVVEGSTTQAQAAELLGLCERQVRRLQRAYRDNGAAALINRRRGRASNNRLPVETREAVLARVRECYADFGPTLAAEYLKSDGYTVSKETLRTWMIAAGLWKPAKGRRQSLHPPRQRRPRLGELVQIDGSPHDWFEGRGGRCTLLAFIDDATSRVLLARFVTAETSQHYLDAVRDYVTRHGCPAAFYSDRHSIFTKHDPEDAEPTQFERAIKALGIAGIQALSPQAKGRVERLFQTLQDRLVKALRLAGIKGMAAANDFLPGYLESHNARFGQPPVDDADAHLPWTQGHEILARHCAIHHSRTVSKDLVVTFNRQRYIVQTGGAPRYALHGQRVTVVAYSDGRIELLHGEELLPFKVFDAPQPATAPVDDKTLNERLEKILKARRSTHKPAPDHPWNRYRAISHQGK